ncbi:MAG: D-serine ammonia-lyase [Halanaerobiales bacterium]|nr:D-serine ammonia-lyase [Halanaerobiales bacterium]
MSDKLDINDLKKKHPLLDKIIKTKEVLWINPDYNKEDNSENFNLRLEDIIDADQRLKRFAPYIKKVFLETEPSEGIIESKLQELNSFKSVLNELFNIDLKGNFFVKRDDSLPIAGSIKARGGIYEVLKHAEELALDNNLIDIDNNYEIFAKEKFKKFFSNYSIQVGSTGNLGLSIGIMGSTLGFKTTVHMSNDAKEWKKELLRKNNVLVREYQSDYSLAVKKGREESKSNPRSYFIDDEKSKDLFLGYAVAALRLKEQFKKQNIKIDRNNPLIVYLPCGVGGGPGGICYGLKKVFADNVYCFFAEPTHSPAMLIGMLTGLHDKISVQDFGIDNITQADGLAVGTPSAFVGKIMKNLLSGIYTISDDRLFTLLKEVFEHENIKLEPSALAGFYGPVVLNKRNNLNKYKKIVQNKEAIHLIWSTGGSMVPEDEFNKYLDK